ncbi:MAG: UDP-N-acetylmuramate dehydrogenase [Elusimicrobiota bacterium]|nr:UDP-N-acetylmuramate dehydrogenase [Elusimicrobiota bacterium]
MGVRIYKNEPLSKHTSFKIGGPADYLLEIPSEKSLMEFLKNSSNEKIFILGGGTNVLFCDEGFRGIIVKLTGDFEKFSFCQNKLICGASANLSAVLRECAKRNLSGLECCAGIPGTVGGAVFGNAGDKDCGICGAVFSIDIVNNMYKELIDRKKLVCEYRKTNISGIITNVNFLLTQSERNGILREILDSKIYKRRQTQPIGIPNAGCVFKNPTGESAGKLIDLAGLKGTKIGGAKISEIHANFIVNENNAKASDVLDLINMVKRKIKNIFGIALQEEIRVIKE